MKKIEVVNKESNPCPKCKLPMEARKHINTQTIKTVYYYSQWDYCKSCHHVQHYDKYKVWKDNGIKDFVYYREETQALFKNL